MKAPQIIIVDGASSAGKTSLVRAFIGLAPRPFRPMAIDDFLPSLPPGVFETRAGSDEGWIDILRDFGDVLAEEADSGESMIVEVVLPWPEARDDLFHRLGRDRIFYVQLCLPQECARELLSVIESRSSARAQASCNTRLKRGSAVASPTSAIA